MNQSLKTETGLRNLQSTSDYVHFSANAMQPWDRLFVERCRALRPDVPKGVLVDVGAGTGVVLECMDRAGGFEGWRLHGLEHFDDMVDDMRARLPDRFEVIPGDAAALPFDDASLDMAVSRATLHHIPDKHAALTEMARVLKPGGIGLIHDPRRDMPEAVRAAFNARRAEVGYAPTTLEEKLTLAEMQALLDQTGLAAISTLHAGTEGVAAIGFEVVIRKV